MFIKIGSKLRGGGGGRGKRLGHGPRPSTTEGLEHIETLQFIDTITVFHCYNDTYIYFRPTSGIVHAKYITCYIRVHMSLLIYNGQAMCILIILIG